MCQANNRSRVEGSPESQYPKSVSHKCETDRHIGTTDTIQRRKLVGPEAVFAASRASPKPVVSPHCMHFQLVHLLRSLRIWKQSLPMLALLWHMSLTCND